MFLHASEAFRWRSVMQISNKWNIKHTTLVEASLGGLEPHLPAPGHPRIHLQSPRDLQNALWIHVFPQFAQGGLILLYLLFLSTFWSCQQSSIYYLDARLWKASLIFISEAPGSQSRVFCTRKVSASFCDIVWNWYEKHTNLIIGEFIFWGGDKAGSFKFNYITSET